MSAIPDPRHLACGFEIPTETYCDQPYVVKTDDGAWLCILTTGAGREGEPGQPVVATRSTDLGRTWSTPAALEPAGGPAAAGEIPIYTLTIENHRFSPAIVEIQENRKVKLLIKNLDTTPEEFDSFDLNREKVIPGNSEGIVFIGPLDPGTYEFIGEFNADTAMGKVIVK